MRARYLNCTVEQLPHRINDPSLWRPGLSINVDSKPLSDPETDGTAFCYGPWFATDRIDPRDGLAIVTCIHLIELDESLADAEVEQAYEELLVSTQRER